MSDAPAGSGWAEAESCCRAAATVWAHPPSPACAASAASRPHPAPPLPCPAGLCAAGVAGCGGAAGAALHLPTRGAGRLPGPPARTPGGRGWKHSCRSLVHWLRSRAGVRAQGCGVMGPGHGCTVGAVRNFLHPAHCPLASRTQAAVAELEAVLTASGAAGGCTGRPGGEAWAGWCCSELSAGRTARECSPCTILLPFPRAPAGAQRRGGGHDGLQALQAALTNVHDLLIHTAAKLQVGRRLGPAWGLPGVGAAWRLLPLLLQSCSSCTAAGCHTLSQPAAAVTAWRPAWPRPASPPPLPCPHKRLPAGAR